MFYPAFEYNSTRICVASIIEYNEADVHKGTAPVEGFDDDRYIMLEEVHHIDYFDNIGFHYSDYYLEEGYNGEPILQIA